MKDDHSIGPRILQELAQGQALTIFRRQFKGFKPASSAPEPQCFPVTFADIRGWDDLARVEEAPPIEWDPLPVLQRHSCLRVRRKPHHDTGLSCSRIASDYVLRHLASQKLRLPPRARDLGRIIWIGA